jgi:16S rRNA (guanine966-N2)-methyltransferase
MRIIAGSLRGRKLIPPEGSRIRPTSDRAREAIFNMLGPKVRGARILDLFAGTGALGIEALSRGASHATFVDNACQTVTKNLKHCKIEDTATVLCVDLAIENPAQTLLGQQFDIVFMDPPYHQGLVEQVVHSPGFTDILSPNAWVVAEYSHKENIQLTVSGLDILKQKKYSKTKISIICTTLQKE